jgi:hypothetical protein
MFKQAIAVGILLTLSMPTYAASDYPSATMQTSLPREAVTVTDWTRSLTLPEPPPSLRVNPVVTV